MTRFITHYCDSCGADMGSKYPSRRRIYDIPIDTGKLHFTLEWNRDLCPVCLDAKVALFIEELKFDMEALAKIAASVMTGRVDLLHGDDTGSGDS